MSLRAPPSLLGRGRRGPEWAGEGAQPPLRLLSISQCPPGLLAPQSEASVPTRCQTSETAERLQRGLASPQPVSHDAQAQESPQQLCRRWREDEAVVRQRSSHACSWVAFPRPSSRPPLHLISGDGSLPTRWLPSHAPGAAGQARKQSQAKCTRPSGEVPGPGSVSPVPVLAGAPDRPDDSQTCAVWPLGPPGGFLLERAQELSPRRGTPSRGRLRSSPQKTRGTNLAHSRLEPPWGTAQGHEHLHPHWEAHRLGHLLQIPGLFFFKQVESHEIAIVCRSNKIKQQLYLVQADVPQGWADCPCLGGKGAETRSLNSGSESRLCSLCLPLAAEAGRVPGPSVFLIFLLCLVKVKWCEGCDGKNPLLI